MESTLNPSPETRHDARPSSPRTARKGDLQKILLDMAYPVGYVWYMNTINQTDEFHQWLDSLKDGVGKGAILGRINRARLGNFGDHKDLGDGVSEMRVDIGPGYRVYYGREGSVVYLLICGGDKSSQDKDIRHAKAIWAQFKKEQQP